MRPGDAKYLELLLDKDHSAQMTCIDPSLPLLDLAAQLFPVPLTCLVFEFLTIKGPSLKARAGTM